MDGEKCLYVKTVDEKKNNQDNFFSLTVTKNTNKINWRTFLCIPINK
jgi:hypothetical protein